MRDVILCLLIKGEEILLGRKKKGFGKDKINGFGGKVEGKESITKAALRELKEESGLIGLEKDLIKYGEIDFFFPESKAKEWNQKVHIFIMNNWGGKPTGSDEISCEAYDLKNIPYDRMWDTDKHWMPHILKGKKIRAEFYFEEDCNTTKHYEITEIERFD